MCSRRWLIEGNLFGYELATSVLVRVLQLSMPDEETAQMIGLCCVIVEVGVRIFFYTTFLKAGLKNPRMTDKEKKKYSKRGKLRVQDARNDMVGRVRVQHRRGPVHRPPGTNGILFLRHLGRYQHQDRHYAVRIPTGARALLRFLRDLHGQ